MHRKGCFKPKQTVCGGFGVCFQSKNNEFQKRGRRRRRGKEKVIGLSQGRRGRRGKSVASWMCRVSGQGTATAAESRIFNRFFLELVWLVLLQQTRTYFFHSKHIMTPWEKGIPRIWSPQLLQKTNIWVQWASKNCLNNSTSQHTLQLYSSKFKICQTKSIRECFIAPGHLRAVLGGFLLPRHKVFSFF